MALKDKVKHKRRYCRMEDCNKIVKSQGLCQRHGAKTRKCKIPECEKQAQGNFDGMCKLHFKITKTQLICKPVASSNNVCLPLQFQPDLITSPEPAGASVYEVILPESVGWSCTTESMPLVKHLKDGFDREKKRGWHRNEERRSRGLAQVTNPAIQLEGWERELVWMEICLLSGSPEASFRHLARAWGRDKGFHMVLAQFICERRGNVERKKRVKGTATTKKQKRAPVELAPGGGVDPQGMLDGFEDMDFDLLCYEGPSNDLAEDPTVNFTQIPNFDHLGGSKSRGKKRPNMCMQQQQVDIGFHHAQAPITGPSEQQQQHPILSMQQQQQAALVAIHQQQAHMQQQQQQHQHFPQSMQQHPGKTLLQAADMITHEDLACEENTRSLFDDPVAV